MKVNLTLLLATVSQILKEDTINLLLFMTPIQNTLDMGIYVQKFEDIVEKRDELEQYAKNKGKIYAFLLYDEQDTKFVDYIANFSMHVGEMAGRNCIIFMISHPPKEYLVDERYQQWVENFVKVDVVLKNPANVASSFNPFRAYEVAQNLGINTKHFPCIVFFKDINSKERIVYRLPRHVFGKDKVKDKNLNDIYKERLRELFGAINLTPDEDERFLDKGRSERWDKLKKHVGSVTRNDKIIGGYEWFKTEAKQLGEIFSGFH